MRYSNLIMVALLISASGVWAAEEPKHDANRLTYLDDFTNPYYAGLSFPKLTTPQWVGEPGVEAVVTLGIDDMRGVARYETYLRPILQRLKQIDGRAPVSIMTNVIDPKEPHLQKWLAEGLSIETHTADHPCPCLAGGNFAKAKSTYDRCVDQISQIPGNRPVAFRFPCMDSLNTPSPRAYAEIINKTTDQGNFLQISTSVCALLTAEDPALPRKLVIDPDGRARFGKYLPFRSFVNRVKNYPYPFVIGRLCWEFPVAVPDDWQGQHLHQSGNPKTAEDIKAVIDAIAIKQGTANITFHPANWIHNRQVVSVIDHVAKKHGRKVKFLNFQECLKRINKNMLSGQPLRAKNGQDNGVRLLDLNGDGYLDVCIGNEKMQKTRVWNPRNNKWVETSFPTLLVHVDKKGNRSEAGVRFGIVRTGGMVSMLVHNDNIQGAWTFDGKRWVEDPKMLQGLKIKGKPVLTEQAGRDQGVRLRDLDRDGSCELIAGAQKQNAVFSWDANEKTWKQAPFALPSGTSIVDSQGRDAGLRFVDVDQDGHDDVLFSNERAYSLHLFDSLKKGWSRHKVSGKRTDDNAIPMITRLGTNNGSWFADGHMWLQNEDTNRLPDGVDRRAFVDMLGDRNPPPKDAKSALRSMRVREGFRIELVAAEPLVMDPVGFDWGHDGRLWVVEMADYPLGLDDKGKPGGRVRFLEDTNGDGKYDRSTLFADGIPYPNSIMAWRKGVLVCAAPNVIYMEDTDGDGRADKKEVLYTGFGEGNQQHRFNGFEWGLDNWIHLANGDSGGHVKSIKTGKVINIGGRDLRIRPGDGSLDPQTGQTQYGRHRDDWGNWFGNSNPIPIMHFVLDDHYLRRNPHFAPPSPNRLIATTSNTQIYPISHVLSHWEGYVPPPPGTPHIFTSACSTIIYRDNLFGPLFAGNTFTSEPVHNLVHRRVLQPHAASYTSHRAAGGEFQEFLASSDSWFRPTSLRIGPDGALWVADMYRLIIEHPEWIDDGEEKRLFLRAGHDKGRIYRIVPNGAVRRKIPALGKFDIAKLVSTLEHPSGWRRDRAHQLLVQRAELLVQRADRAAIPLLTKMATDGKSPQARLHSLCALHGLSALTSKTLTVALGDSHPGVRRNAARIAGELKDLPENVVVALLQRIEDKDIHVRIACAYALGEWDDPRAGVALGKLALADSNQYVSAAVLSSVNGKNVGDLLAVVLAGSNGKHPPVKLVESLLRMATAIGNSDGLLHTLTTISKRTDGKQLATWQLAALVGMMDALDRQKKTLAQLGAKATKKQRVALMRTHSVFQLAGTHLTGEKKSLARKLLWVRLMGRNPESRQKDLLQLSEMLSPQTDGQLQLAVVKSLARTADPKAPKLLTSGWKSHGIHVRRAVLAALLARPKWQSRLLDFVADGLIRPADLDAAQRGLLQSNRDPAAKQRAAKVLALSVNQDRAKVLADHLGVLTMRGDRDRGAVIFKKTCSSCHRIDNFGNVVGPDLRALSNRSPRALLTALLDPNRAVEDKYRSYQALTEDGRQITGVLAGETGASITLLDIEGHRHDLLRSEIEELRAAGNSLMPEGLEKDLNPQQFADVIAYVGTLGQPAKKFANQKPQLVRPDKGGVLKLPAASAEIYGPTLLFEQKYHNLGYFASAEDYALWTFEIPKSGKYQLSLDYAVEPSSAGDVLVVESGATRIHMKVASTGSWDEYRNVSLGHLVLESGIQTIVVRPLKKPHSSMIDIRTLILSPEIK